MNKIIALAGNPNVGKSTVFNALTGLHQHTGNWPGKTVSNAIGNFKSKNNNYKIYDLPGIYSILAHSEEEYVARDFVCFGGSDVTIVVCDAVCLMRNLNLVLQICEITDNVIVCVNLLDEAEKKKINVDLDLLSKYLKVKVVGTSARSNKGLDDLVDTIDEVILKKNKSIKVEYNDYIENAINIVEESVKEKLNNRLNSRWVSLNLLCEVKELTESINNYLGYSILDEDVSNSIIKAKQYLLEKDILTNELEDYIVTSINDKAKEIADLVTCYEDDDYDKRDRKIDKILTSKFTGIPIMILMFIGVFWLTIVGSNYPSGILQDLLFSLESKLLNILDFLRVPDIIINISINGIYRVLAWVVSVMLPPMAIFFPLFTLLEDVGYLPRIAFNMDGIFKKCSACGKQALTMAMGFGCNAVGVSGCRIIDSPRERLIAILTNVFVPCNGRFPTLIAIITMFFAFGNSFFSVLILTILVLFGILMTFIISKVLSKTLLKGINSSFTLELPPYRRPQILKVIIRSIFDRTLFVLGRAVLVAIPAGLIIWLMANVNIGGVTLLNSISAFLDPFAKLMGMDGIILFAFILGFPANEIVIPIIIMGYMATGSLVDISDLTNLKELFVNNGWTFITAISVMLFSLMHWPCSTTCLTIKKETNSWKWTGLSILIPTIVGIIICMLFNLIVKLFV